MNILIVGGTGFIGQHLTKTFIKEGYHVYISTRKPNKYGSTENITYVNSNVAVTDLPKISVVINLAGESLFGYWTENKKKRILQSRIQSTKRVVQLMEQMEHPPEMFINASAIGYYGTSDEVIFTEATKQQGDDFLASVVKKWEDEAMKAESLGIRTVYARFGLVLGEGGALPLMSLPIKFGVGGKIGNGEQYMSW